MDFIGDTLTARSRRGRARNGYVPRYLEVAEEIEAAIRRGDHGPNELLPTERALAARYGLNRNTVAHALQNLQTRGLVYRIRGRGTFVNPGRLAYKVTTPPSSFASIEALGLTPRQQVLAVDRIRPYADAAERLELRADEYVLFVERVRLAGNLPLVYGGNYVREEMFPGLEARLHGSWQSLTAVLREHFGVELRRASTVVEVEPAGLEVASKLHLAAGTPLLKVSHLDVDPGGRPAYWSVGYSRADVMRIEIVHPEAAGDHK
jgi:DNA-binding GntR family transcriptional regulator